eukprot:2675987-Rhodomonas_salina.1
MQCIPAPSDAKRSHPIPCQRIRCYAVRCNAMPSADRERAVVQGTVEERIVQAAQVCRCHCSQYHYGDIFPSFSVAMSWLLVFRPAIAGSNAKMSGSIC